MSSLNKEWRALPAGASPPLSDGARLLAAALLAAASRSLARSASALMPVARPVMSDPRLEFHAQAGAPEGALYVDGELVGRLPGVQRL